MILRREKASMIKKEIPRKKRVMGRKRGKRESEERERK